MGLVQSVRQRRKKQKLQHLPGEDSGTMDTQNNSDVVNSNTSHYNELYYTMVGHARGPNVPIGILTGLSKDMTERYKRHQDTLQRIESLQSLLNQIESSSTSSSSSLSSSSSSSNPPVALLAAYLRETKKENPQFVASHGLYQTLWDMTVSKNKAWESK